MENTGVIPRQTSRMLKDRPAASASAALLHGNEWSDSGSIWKTAPLIILLSWIAIAVVTVVLGGVLF